MGFFDLGAGDLLGAGAGLLGGMMQNASNAEQAKMMMEFNAAEAAKDRNFQHAEAYFNRDFQHDEALSGRVFGARMTREQRNYETRMAGSAHQREVRDLKKAGLNPILGISHGGSATPSVPLPSAPVGHGGQASGSRAGGVMAPHMENIVSQAVSTALRLRENRATVNQLAATTAVEKEKLNTQAQETRRVAAEADNLEILNPGRKSHQTAEISELNTRASANQSRAGRDYADSHLIELTGELRKAETQSEINHAAKIIAETQLARVHSAKAETERRLIVTELPARLKEMGIDESKAGTVLIWLNRLLGVGSSAVEMGAKAAGGAAAIKYATKGRRR